jgi:hypothetical protein
MYPIRGDSLISLLLMSPFIGCQHETSSEVARGTQSKSILGSKPGEEREIAGVKFCWCRPGTFLIGSPANESDRRPDENQEEEKGTQLVCRGLKLFPAPS